MKKKSKHRPCFAQRGPENYFTAFVTEIDFSYFRGVLAPLH